LRTQKFSQITTSNKEATTLEEVCKQAKFKTQEEKE